MISLSLTQCTVYTRSIPADAAPPNVPFRRAIGGLSIKGFINAPYYQIVNGFVRFVCSYAGFPSYMEGEVATEAANRLKDIRSGSVRNLIQLTSI